MRTLGVIGGMGPLASAYFMEQLTRLTDAQTDQQHLPVLLVSDPTVPDRTAYILGESDENPAPVIGRLAKKLERMGADMICVTCVTSHYFFDRLQKEATVPLLNMVEITAKALRQMGTQTVGLLATSGTIQTQVLQKACEHEGISCVCPDLQEQELVMQVIYQQIKAGKKANLAQLNGMATRLKQAGAQKIILGCTELCLLKQDLDDSYIDPLNLLAKKAILEAGKAVR